MNRKWLDAGTDFLGIVMDFLAVFCAETAVFSLLSLMGTSMETGAFTAPSAARQAALLVVPLLFWQIRERAERFWLFVGCHALVAAAAVLFLDRTPFGRFVFGAFTAFYLIRSFYTRFSEKDEWGNVEKPQKARESRPGAAVSAAVGVGAFWICAYLGDEVGCSRIWRVALIFAFLFFVDAYLRNLGQFVQFNRASNAHIPVKGMFLRGGGLTAAFGVVTVLVLGIGTNSSLMDGLSEGIKRIGLWLVRLVLGAIGFILSFFSSEEEAAAVEQEVSSVPELGALEAAAQPLWVEILEKVLEYLVLAALAALACYLIYRLVSAAIRRFYERRGAVREENGQAVEIRESLLAERRKERKEKGLPFWARTPEERIRKCFLKAVRQSERFRNPEGNPGGGARDPGRREAQERLVYGRTARQIGEAAGLPESVSGYEELLGLYEKARYGRGCTAEEAKRCEKLL